MEVNTPIIGIAEHKTRRKFVHNTYKAVHTKEMLRPLSIVKRNNKIQIIVWARLHSEQRIDTPSSIQPDQNATCL